MQLCGAVFPFAARRFLAKLPVPVVFICHHFVAQDVEHLVEVRPGIDRHVQRKHFRPVMCARVGQHFVEVRVLFVHALTTMTFGMPQSVAQFHTRSVPTPMPCCACTTTTAKSATRTAASASLMKSR